MFSVDRSWRKRSCLSARIGIMHLTQKEGERVPCGECRRSSVFVVQAMVFCTVSTRLSCHCLIVVSCLVPLKLSCLVSRRSKLCFVSELIARMRLWP